MDMNNTQSEGEANTLAHSAHTLCKSSVYSENMRQVYFWHIMDKAG